MPQAVFYMLFITFIAVMTFFITSTSLLPNNWQSNTSFDRLDLSFLSKINFYNHYYKICVSGKHSKIIVLVISTKPEVCENLILH
jgi:hypothetical protein